MVLIAALIVALAPVTPATAANVKVTRAHLDVLGSPGCITRDNIASRVAARSSRIRLDADDASVEATVTVTSQQPGNVTAELRMMGPDTAATPRRVVARSCQEAADAVALMMAVTLDPTPLRNAPRSATTEPARGRETLAPPAHAPPPVRNEPRPSATVATAAPAIVSVPAEISTTAPAQAPVVLPARTTPPPRPIDAKVHPSPGPIGEVGPASETNLQFGGGLAGQAVFGAAPSALLGVGVTLMLAAERSGLWAPALLVGGAHVVRSGLSEPGGTASFTLDAGVIDGCPSRWRWSRVSVRPCASLLVGRLATQGGNTNEPASAVRPFGASGLALAATFGRTLQISGRLGVGVALIRDSYKFDTTFFRADWLIISASLGVGASWP
jgi:hypothetical protein